MAHVKVTVEGVGNFEIDTIKVDELVSWLSCNKAVKIVKDNTISEVKDDKYTGRILLNEQI